MADWQDGGPGKHGLRGSESSSGKIIGYGVEGLSKKPTVVAVWGDLGDSYDPDLMTEREATYAAFKASKELLSRFNGREREKARLERHVNRLEEAVKKFRDAEENLQRSRELEKKLVDSCGHWAKITSEHLQLAEFDFNAACFFIGFDLWSKRTRSFSFRPTSFDTFVPERFIEVYKILGDWCEGDVEEMKKRFNEVGLKGVKVQGFRIQLREEFGEEEVNNLTDEEVMSFFE